MLSQLQDLNSKNSSSNINSINCPNATSPVNISMDSIMGPCVLKCDYNYNYNNANKKQKTLPSLFLFIGCNFLNIDRKSCPEHLNDI